MTLAQLGQFHYTHQQYAEAANRFRAVVALVPDSPTHRRNLAGVYIAMGRYADAEHELRQSIALKPTSGAYSNLGAMYIYLGRYADAIDALQQAIRLSPARSGSIYTYWGNLGDAYRYTPGQSAKAADAYRHAVQEAEQQLAFDPDNASLLASMAEYQVKMGDQTRALDAIGRAMRFAHGDKKVSFKAALVYELTGSRDRALAALGDAIRGGYSLDDIGREPELKALRQDPRYQELLASQSGKTASK
jgi:serine/threonine-protein kinase